LAACVLIAAGSSAGEQDSVQVQLRAFRPDTFVIEPAAPIAGAEWASLYRAVLVVKVRRAAPGAVTGRRG